MLGVDEGNIAAAGAKNELALILEHHLDDLVGIAEENGLLCSLPLLYVNELLIVTVLAGWSVLFGEAELEGLKLLVAVQVALKVL